MPNSQTIDPTNPLNPESFQENPPHNSKKILQIIKQLRNKWLNLPKWVKFLSIAGTVFLLIFGLLFFFNRQLSVLKKKLIGQLPQDAGNWQRLLIPQRQSPFFTMTTYQEKKFGILPDEKLILQLEKPLDQAFIEENLESSIPVTVKASDNNTYEITPANKVGLDQLISLKLNVKDKSNQDSTFDRDYSWAFQTQGKFRIVSSIPGNEKTNVPVNTGIEIVFSQDDYQDPSNFISIAPNIKYRTEKHGATFAIVPEEPLQEKTVYTVTLKKGLNLESRHDPLSEDYQFSFQTKENEEENQKYFSLANDFVQISPSEKLQTKVYLDNLTQLKADVYIFNSANDFIQSRDQIDEAQASWRRYYTDNEKFDVSKLDKVMSTDLDVQTINNDDYLATNYVQLPETLAKGFYLIEFFVPGDNGAKEQIQQLWVQSTNLTAYVSVAKEQTLVWVNTFGAGPVANAQVKLVDSQFSAISSEQGLATFNTPTDLFDKKRQYFAVTAQDEQVFLIVDSLKGLSLPNELTADDYWTYFYHDRVMYQSSDTVDFFGVIKKRADSAAPSIITVELLKGYEETIIAAKNIVPASDGSFIGDFSFTDLPEGWYDLRVIVAGKDILWTGFSVEEFVKPEMKIEVIGDQKAIFAGDKVDFLATTRFFDDTPVANTPVNIYLSHATSDNQQKVTTDKNGQISYQYQSPKRDGDRYPRYESITIQPDNAQEATVEGFGSVLVFDSQVMMETVRSTDRNDNQAKFKALVSRVDLSGINQGTTSEYQGQAIPNHEVQLTLTKKWYEKIEKGTYYDFIEKTTKKSYEYKHHEEKIETKTLKTDQEGMINYQFDMESDKSYEVDAVTYDQYGNPADVSSYFYHSHYTEDASQNSNYPTLNIKQEKNEFSLGESVDAEIKAGGDLYPVNKQSQFLFITAQNGQQKTFVNDQPTYSFNFEKEHIPNIYLGAVVFNGRYYLQATINYRYGWYYQDYYSYDNYYYFNGVVIHYRETDSEIDLTLEPEKNVYQPGDQAKIKVKASHNNQAVANANINLVLVDQALAAIGGVIEPSILTGLYATLPHYVYYGYGSHQPMVPDEAQAEMGGGGGDRDLFKDSAFFGTLRTNDQGEAEFTFDLPDNITTWIVYAQAIDQEINAGWEEGKLTVSKDFFVTSQFPKEYLARDKAVLSASAYGTSLNSNNTINFQAIFEQGETELANNEQQAQAFTNVYFDFPALGVGNYQAILRGQINDKNDGIKLPFEVIDSRFYLENASVSTLNQGDIQQAIGVEKVLSDKEINVVVSDQGKGLYYRSLNKFCYASSNRLEKQLASVTASSILKEHFAKDCQKTNANLNQFQAANGGLSQVNWGGANLETSAWATYIDVSNFDQPKLISYFENILNNADSDLQEQIYAAWALSELGKPQVVKLDLLRTQATSFDEKVILGIAYVSIGDQEKALDLYYELLADYAYQSGPYIRIQTTAEKENADYVVRTSHALLLGELTDNTYNEGLANYLQDFRDRAENLVIDLAEIAYIEEQIKKLPAENTKIYFKTSSIEDTRDLSKGCCIVYPLKADEINNFYLEVLSGKAESYITYYVDSASAQQLAQDDQLTIDRSYQKVKDDGRDIKAGDIVQITINFDLNDETSPPGMYLVTDYLPSGLKFIENPSLFGLVASGWPAHQDQVVSYYFYNSPWWRSYGEKQIIYFARAGSVGTYTAEPALIQSQRVLSVFRTTRTEEIQIQPSN